MTICILCNMGARDVMLRQKDRLEELRPARTQGEMVYQNYQDYADRVALPIVEPAMNYILAREAWTNLSENQPLCRVILLGTDQRDLAYQASDTLFFARIAALKLGEMFGTRVQAEARLVNQINPAFYDEAYEKFGELLSELDIEVNSPVYVVLAGGIPACNTALLLQGVRLFGEHLTVVYPPVGGEPQELRVGRQISNAFREAAAIERLNELDFVNALPHFQFLKTDAGVVGLVKYAAQRLAFDFQSAQETLEQALAASQSETRQFIQKSMRHQLDVLLNQQDRPERLLALLEELYWNASITYRHQQFADFLGRVYRFQEAVLRYLVEIIYSLPTDLRPAVRNQNQQNWEEGIQANRRLTVYCESQLIDGQPMNWRTIGRPTYKALLAYAVDAQQGLGANEKPLLSGADQQRYHALLDKVNKLDRLVELRHRTIIGHDFVGVSEALLLANSPAGISPPIVLADILQMLLKRKMGVGDYEQIARFVISALRMR